LNKQFSFLTHIVDHDKRFTEFVMANFPKVRH
jgi:hypothetical protein